jgi:DNA-directed RNA polymerase specialized sigma24 family protein
MKEDTEGGRLFASTRWSVVLRAQDKSATAMGTLCESYRQPLIVWLRSRGATPHDAEDTVQGLLAQLLAHDFLRGVAQNKGRFRTFLLQCLKNYVRDQHDKQSAAKRGGGVEVGSLDCVTEGGQPVHDPAAPEAGPDLEYDRAWARTVLASALHRLESECARQGHAELCSALQPVMFADETAAPYRGIGDRLGMTEQAVKMAAYRIRNRLKELVREEVKQTLANEEDWQAEVRYLIQLFGR